LTFAGVMVLGPACQCLPSQDLTEITAQDGMTEC
jgi:hypothetical protein